MKTFRRILALILTAMTVGSLAFAQHAAAQEAPDALVKRISLEVLDLAKADQEIQAGNQKRVRDLVEAKILPHVDFQHMTALASGPDWSQATPEQQSQLTGEFRALLMHTYSGAIAQIKDQKVTFKPMRADPANTKVEVRTTVAQRRGDQMPLNYRLEKLADGWKIYDINISGAWLVETYKSSFTTEIGKNGFNGLIKLLSDKNRKLAESAVKVAKPV
ncbi:MAG: MlaC/ttg2D family ABC transporter substrate-binding protein [Burkholderiaceae bacterium]